MNMKNTLNMMKTMNTMNVKNRMNMMKTMNTMKTMKTMKNIIVLRMKSSLVHLHRLKKEDIIKARYKSHSQDHRSNIILP